MAIPAKQFPHLLIVVCVRPGSGRDVDVKSGVGRRAVVSVHHLRTKAWVTVDCHEVAGEGLAAHVRLWLVLRRVSELRAHAIVHRGFDREVAILLGGHAVGNDVFGRCWSWCWGYLSKLAILLLLLMLLLRLLMLLLLLLLCEPCSGGMELHLIVLLTRINVVRLSGGTAR